MSQINHQNKELRIKYQNTRGLRTKMNEFSLNLASSDEDIICLTETWLHSGFLSSEYFINNYKSYRRDRDYESTGTTRGGGCWIIHKSSLISNRVSSFESNIDFVEDVWIEIAQPTGRLLLCTVYITSMVYRSNLYEQFFDKVRHNLASIDSHDRVLIVGDFNLSEITWTKNSDGGITFDNLISLESHELINLMNYGKLSQYNPITNNRNSGILDLVLSTDHFSSIEVRQTNQCLVPEDDYHPTLEITVKDPIGFMISDESFKKLNFRKANYEQISAELEQIDWNFLQNSDISTGVDKFNEIINSIIERNVPVRKNRSKYPFWFSSELRNLLKEKERARRKWTKSNNANHYLTFSELRAKCKKLIDSCHSDYVKSLQNNIKSNIRLFWAYTKKRRQTNSYPSKFEFNGETTNDPSRVCEMFSDYFKSNFIDHPSDPSRISIPVQTSNTSNSYNISPIAVSEILSSLDENKNGGPDRIPNIFWKKTSALISTPLSYMFSRSLNTALFPNAFKTALIMPIHKKGDTNLIENYRPISMLNTVSLVFEKVVFNIVCVQTLNKLIRQQHGFRKGESTGTNLFDFINYIAQAMDEGLEVHAIYTDFSKAFDRVRHDKLIFKLNAIGLSQLLI